MIVAAFLLCIILVAVGSVLFGAGLVQGDAGRTLLGFGLCMVALFVYVAMDTEHHHLALPFVLRLTWSPT